MREALGVALLVGGILLGLWLGIWVLFIGGIVSIVEAAKANPVDAHWLAWGILKVTIASPVGWLCVFSGIALGTHVADR